jgi:hypothetical protein
LPVKSDP